MEAVGTKVRPRGLSKSALKNEAKSTPKMYRFSALFGAIWAPKIIKIEPGASKRPPEEQQAHKKRPRGTKSIKKSRKTAKNVKKTPHPNIFAVFPLPKTKQKSNKKAQKPNRKKNLYKLLSFEVLINNS